jgi:ribosomal protein L14E/L6E/L27E
VAESGCGEGLQCAKVILDEAAKTKAQDKSGVDSEKVAKALENTEICVKSDQCDKLKDGVKYECKAQALAASIISVFVIVLGM